MCGISDELLGSWIDAVAGLAGVIIGILSTVAFAWWSRPKLKIEFDREEDCFTTTEEDYESEELDSHGQSVVKKRVVTLLRVRVKNEGRTMAERCRVWLLKIERWENGHWEKTICNEAFPVVWSYSPNTETIDIPKGADWHADIVSFWANECFFQPRLRNELGQVFMPKRFVKLFATAGRYRLKVMVSGQHAKPRYVDIEFRWKPKTLPLVLGIRLDHPPELLALYSE